MKRIGASILLLGSIVLFSSVARALETLEEKQLRWILYDDWPEDKISEDTPKVLSEVRYKDGTVSQVLKPPEPPPSDIERERKKWDKMIALDNTYFEHLAKRRKANTMEGQARLVQIAQFVLEGQPEKWATGVLLREADKPTRSRAVRDALASLLKRPEEELPYSHDDSRSIAYEWLEEFGDGMTKREQKLYEKYEGAPYEK